MRSLLVLISMILVGLVLRAQDFQSWNEIDVAASWRKVDFLAPMLARTDSSLPNPQLAATGVMVDFSLPWRLTLTGGYLFAELPQESLQVHVPLIALTKSVRLGRTTLADRNRFEKLFQYANQPVRYRNRFLVDEILGWHNRCHAFAEDEVIWDVTDAAWSQNRLQAGGGFMLNRRLLLDVYYLRRNAAGGAIPVNVLGTNLRISFTSTSKRR